ncbi:uncharacterized protein LOC110022248 [Phalaenopsis equestris]|uniref:uncharacterized protein LOC110022248 n=1 Tax=Phalaenopsis equestris TaxID=78828 RepID=UPI0009E426F7|nr:uncharacterized protein LOC110022248 [Phalaenopsis equestris]
MESGDSKIWKSILKAQSIASRFIFWDIGEGKISFWHDQWGLGDHNTFAETPENNKLLISDVWIDENWDISKLFSLAGDKTAHVTKIPIKKTTIGTPLWKTSSTISPSKMLYSHLSNLFSFDKWRWGKPIWNNFFTPSVSFFLWRYLFNLLPLDDILKLKGLKLASRCQLCNREEESAVHLFFQCSYAKEVWFILGKNFHVNWRDCIDIVDFLHIWRAADILDSKLAFFSMLVIWFLWTTRNDIKYQNLTPVPSTSASLILAYFTRACRIMGLRDVFPHPKESRMATLVRWQSPPFGWIKVNFDGS